MNKILRVGCHLAESIVALHTPSVFRKLTHSGWQTSLCIRIYKGYRVAEHGSANNVCLLIANNDLGMSPIHS